MANTQFVSPVMRFVQGDAFEPQTKDAQGNPRVVKSGPNAGQPAPQFFIAGAIPKNDPDWPAFEASIKECAAAAFPQLFPQGPHGPCVNPQFSYKIIDGDGIDTTGKPNNQKEGFAGHWIVRFTTAFQPSVFPQGRYSPLDRINDKNLLRRGYYIRVAGTMSGNDNMQRPGVYMNMQLIEVCGYGPEIISGPDAAEAFKTPARLPAGASPTPVAASAVAAAPLQAYGVPQQHSVPMATAFPISAPQPYGGYMQPPAAAPAPVATSVPSVAPMAPPPAPAPVPAGPVMTAKAGGIPYASFISQGWTDDTLRANGYIA